jgi:hypothetical protein
MWPHPFAGPDCQLAWRRWRLRTFDALVASPTDEPPPSRGEFCRFIPINLRIAVARLRQIEESFQLFELF